MQRSLFFNVEYDHRRRGCLRSLEKELLACSELLSHDPRSQGLSSFLSGEPGFPAPSALLHVFLRRDWLL